MNSDNVVNLCGTSQYALFSASQKAAINDLPIPKELNFLAAGQFDDKSISTDSNEWRYRYSGNIQTVFYNKLKCPYKIRLTKFIASQYTIDKLPSKLSGLVYGIRDVLDWFERHHLELSKKNLIELLDRGEWDEFSYGVSTFFFIVFFMRTLSEFDFPMIGEDIEDDLIQIARPQNEGFLIYQDIDNVISNENLTMILNGLWGMSKAFDGKKKFKTEHLMDASVLGLEYVTGARPVQLDKLVASDFNVDTRVKVREIGRYSIAMPYAKTGSLTPKTERINIALPYEVANLIQVYIKQKELKPDDKLFPVG